MVEIGGNEGFRGALREFSTAFLKEHSTYNFVRTVMADNRNFLSSNRFFTMKGSPSGPPTNPGLEREVSGLGNYG
jgi:hypothetical protein